MHACTSKPGVILFAASMNCGAFIRAECNAEEDDKGWYTSNPNSNIFAFFLIAAFANTPRDSSFILPSPKLFATTTFSLASKTEECDDEGGKRNRHNASPLLPPAFRKEFRNDAA